MRYPKTPRRPKARHTKKYLSQDDDVAVFGTVKTPVGEPGAKVGKAQEPEAVGEHGSKTTGMYGNMAEVRVSVATPFPSGISPPDMGAGVGRLVEALMGAFMEVFAMSACPMAKGGGGKGVVAVPGSPVVVGVM
jgi:hypothetical protein